MTKRKPGALSRSEMGQRGAFTENTARRAAKRVADGEHFETVMGETGTHIVEEAQRRGYPPDAIGKALLNSADKVKKAQEKKREEEYREWRRQRESL